MKHNISTTKLSKCLMGERGPVPTLLLHLCNLYLDLDILNTTTDPTLLYKLLIAKLNPTPQVLLIKILRQCRNNIEHNADISNIEYALYFAAVREMYIWISKENFDTEDKKKLQLVILDLCVKILDSVPTSTDDVENVPLSYFSSDVKSRPNNISPTLKEAPLAKCNIFKEKMEGPSNKNSAFSSMSDKNSTFSSICEEKAESLSGKNSAFSSICEEKAQNTSFLSLSDKNSAFSSICEEKMQSVPFSLVDLPKSENIHTEFILDELDLECHISHSLTSKKVKSTVRKPKRPHKTHTNKKNRVIFHPS